MAQHMLTPPDVNFVDKRKAANNDEVSHLVGGPTIFTANAVGTTTTIVGANAAPDTNTNVVRIGDKFKLFSSTGSLKEEKVFTVTSVAVAASTTVTFSPPAAVATASGDFMKDVGPEAFHDNDSLDARLNTINGTLYSQANLDKMTQNDKVYALRVNDDPGSF